MHLLIPFAFSLSEACHATLADLKLPHLHKLLTRMQAGAEDAQDEFTFSPPHERALAQACGLPLQDGMLPWAAWQAHTRALDGALDAGWGYVTPCHWQMGTHYMAMGDPARTQLTQQDSNALLATLQPFFESDGLALYPDQPERWLARGALLRDLASASLDRVSGCDIAPWMPRGPGATTWQRLQSEVQMLLYHHPVNDARTAQGLVPINSFWLSGTGALPAAWQAPGASPVVAANLREAALAQDWSAWARAWQTLDATACKNLLQALADGGAHQLTLCGERSARTWRSVPQSPLQRFMNQFASLRTSSVLEQL